MSALRNERPPGDALRVKTEQGVVLRTFAYKESTELTLELLRHSSSSMH